MNGFWQTLRRKRAVLLSLCGVLALCVLAASTARRGGAVPASAEVTNWGLSFQQEGEPPVGNASSEYLAQYNALYRADAILDALKQHNVPATFFLVGNYLETQPELVCRMVEEGHTVGNHTYSHPDMSAIADAESFRQELEKNEALYREVTGQEMPKLYRPPQGKFCESNLRMAQQLGYRTVFWSLAYVDWYQDEQPTPEQAFEKLVPRVHPGAVVLLHSTSSTNAAILDELLTRWEELGYSFGRLEEITL